MIVHELDSLACHHGRRMRLAIDRNGVWRIDHNDTSLVANRCHFADQNFDAKPLERLFRSHRETCRKGG